MLMHWKFITRVVVSFIIIPVICSEILFRYYFWRWNNNLSVPFVLFARPFPHSESIDRFISTSKYPGVLFELLPNIRSTFLGKPFQTNSRGFIGDREFTQQKPYGTYRIIGIGDSLMSSWGVNPDDTFLSHLERMLRKRFKTDAIEIMNMGTPGYNTAIEYSVIKEKALGYDPDLIILQFYGNDLDLPNWIRRRVHAVSYLLFVVRSVIGMYTTGSDEGGGAVAGSMLTFAPVDEESQLVFRRYAYTVGDVPSEYAYMVGKENFIRTMQGIARLSRELNIPVILLLADDSILGDAPQVRQMGFTLLNASEQLDSYLRSHSMTYAEVSIGPNDIHLNKFGHSLYADMLFRTIESDPRIPVVIRQK
jgi:lysophospholipase L1-like esterase